MYIFLCCVFYIHVINNYNYINRYNNYNYTCSYLICYLILHYDNIDDILYMNTKIGDIKTMSDKFKIEVIDDSSNSKFQNLQYQLACIQEFIHDNKEFLGKIVIHIDPKINSNSKQIFAVDLSNKNFIEMFKDLKVSVEEINKGYKCSYTNSYGIKFFTTFYKKQINDLILSTDLIKDLKSEYPNTKFNIK